MSKPQRYGNVIDRATRPPKRYVHDFDGQMQASLDRGDEIPISRIYSQKELKDYFGIRKRKYDPDAKIALEDLQVSG